MGGERERKREGKQDSEEMKKKARQTWLEMVGWGGGGAYNVS